ncbi:outer membrane beta-barrel protein [Gelidibacter japonicus]|uniref:outer membrane beta-barrel protein n=1 Tax=Gelidibacter japonicus TaxID=1962232 RepID=UPI003A907646
MKQKLLLTILLIFSINSFSQDSKFSIELSYPILVNEKGNDLEFIDFNGIIDLGVKYNLTENKKVDFGVGINTTLLKFKVDDVFVKFTRSHYIFQPKIFGKINLIENEKLALITGLGYSFDFNSTENENSKTYSGISFNAGLRYLLTEKIFFHIQYDFIMYNKEELVYYNKNLSLIKIGIGVKL